MKIPAILLSLMSLTTSGYLEARDNRFITLGTAGGPEASAERAQPANALVVDEAVYLVDVGDGAAGQLKKAGFRLTELNGIFISHNHFDHTGGLLAVIGLRMQLNARNTLKIYGPAGTKAFVNGLIKSMGPSMEAAYGMPGKSWQAHVEVQDLKDKENVSMPGFTVSAIENTHFAIPQNAATKEKAKSLSYRFELADRSIVFTGDTGPSASLVKLAQGADILISEMMDIPVVLDFVRKSNPHMPDYYIDNIAWHFNAHHLLPQQVSELAKMGGVKHLVVTHMVPSIRNENMVADYRARMSQQYAGKITFAEDLQAF